MNKKGTDKSSKKNRSLPGEQETNTLIREEAVARGKKLCEQPGYPDNLVANALAGMLMPYLK